jgi:hypothetical protein
MGKRSDLVQGTLDLLILKTISLEPKHGWAIAKRIHNRSPARSSRFSKDRCIPRCTGSSKKAWIKAESAETETGKESQILFVDCCRASAA